MRFTALFLAFMLCFTAYAYAGTPVVSYGHYSGPPIEDITLNVPKMNEISKEVGLIQWKKGKSPLPLKINVVENTSPYSNDFPWLKALRQAIGEMENLTEVEVDKKNIESRPSSNTAGGEDGYLEVFIKENFDRPGMVGWNNGGPYGASCSFVEDICTNDRFAWATGAQIGIAIYPSLMEGIYATFYQEVGEALGFPSSSYLEIPKWVELSQMGEMGVANSLHPLDRAMAVLIAKGITKLPESHTMYRDAVQEYPEIWQTNDYYVSSYFADGKLYTTVHMTDLNSGDDYWFDVVLDVWSENDGSIKARIVDVTPVGKPENDKVASEFQQIPFPALHVVRMSLGEWDDSLVAGKYIYADFIMNEEDKATGTFTLYRYGFLMPNDEDRVERSPYNCFGPDDGMEVRYNYYNGIVVGSKNSCNNPKLDPLLNY